MTATSAIVRKAFAAPTKLTGSQWADQHGWISRSSGAAEPGRYSCDRSPYMREFLDVACDETHRDILVKKPAQIGFTEAFQQVVAYNMSEDPSGIVMIRPSIDDAKAWMKERVDPMLAESPRLRGLIRSENGRRTSDDTMQRKVFPGGWLVAVGANSPTGLRGRSSRRLYGDERSGWTLDARMQGDPWDLGHERTTTFWNAKRIQGSTPGEMETCPITKGLPDTDWREWHVACPACGFTEPFRWKATDGTYRLVCDKGAADELIPQTARYLCTACGVLIPESEKARMNRNGRWVPRYPGREHVGFDFGTSLLSPWLSWPEIIQKWVKTRGNAENLKVFVTHTLGEAWRSQGERIDVHTLSERAEPMPVLPAQVGAIVASIDVQADRLESLVVGIGAGDEAWVLEWAQHEGDPTTDDPWREAWAHLNQDRGARLFAVAIDTQFLTDEAWRRVHAWNNLRTRVIGVKGMPGRGRPWIAKPGAVTASRQRRPWLVGVDTAKDAIALRLRTPVPPGGPGAFHFAATLDPAFYEQLTAEELRTVLVSGRQTRAWRPIAGRRNEGLDLAVYALAAYYSLGPQFARTVAQLAAVRAQVAAEPEQAPASEALSEADLPRRPAPRRPGSYVSRWRS